MIYYKNIFDLTCYFMFVKFINIMSLLFINFCHINNLELISLSRKTGAIWIFIKTVIYQNTKKVQIIPIKY